MPELWRDIDKVKNTPHMNWSDCPCKQCSIWRIVAALQRAEAERDDLTEQLDLAFEMQREYLAHAKRVEAERDRLMKLISVRETDWEANKAAINRVEAYCEDSSLWRDITVAGVLAALRGDHA